MGGRTWAETVETTASEMRNYTPLIRELPPGSLTSTELLDGCFLLAREGFNDRHHAGLYADGHRVMRPPGTASRRGLFQRRGRPARRRTRDRPAHGRRSGFARSTRFLLADEMPIHEECRRLLIAATETDAERYANLYEVGWPDAPHRALHNSTAERWEAAGQPPPWRRSRWSQR